MRFKDFLITIIISTITSLIVIWTLINAGIIQTQHQSFQKQNYTGTLIGVYNETSKMYEAEIDKLPIENVSDKTTIRLIHISLEANITNYDAEGRVDINFLQLKDQQTQMVITEKSLHFEPNSYGFLNIDTNADPIRALYMTIKILGNYNFTLAYNLTVIQEVIT